MGVEHRHPLPLLVLAVERSAQLLVRDVVDGRRYQLRRRLTIAHVARRVGLTACAAHAPRAPRDVLRAALGAVVLLHLDLLDERVEHRLLVVERRVGDARRVEALLQALAAQHLAADEARIERVEHESALAALAVDVLVEPHLMHLRRRVHVRRHFLLERALEERRAVRDELGDLLRQLVDAPLRVARRGAVAHGLVPAPDARHAQQEVGRLGSALLGRGALWEQRLHGAVARRLVEVLGDEHWHDERWRRRRRLGQQEARQQVRLVVLVGLEREKVCEEVDLLAHAHLPPIVQDG